jgi:hypothetical protein
MLSEVPGIIEACTMITTNPDGTVSFSVLIDPVCGADAGRDLIELIIRPEHIRSGLADAKIRALVTSGSERDEEAPTFPCHVGFSPHNAVTSAAHGRRSRAPSVPRL